MKTVPFISNTEDNLHCYQAAICMVLKYFLPEKTFSMKQLDAMAGYKEGFWTWPMKGVGAMKLMGLNVLYMYNFDYQQFAQKGEKYFHAKYGDEITIVMRKFSDMKVGKEESSTLLQIMQPTMRIPTIHDIQHLLGKGYLVICWVNAHALNRKEGIEGHFVVVYECTGNFITFHDPGLPPQKSRRAATREFENAWGYPNDDAKLIIGVRK